MPPPVPAVRRMSAVGTRLNPEKFLGQDYIQLHKDFCTNRARFLDSTFPPNENAIGPGLLTDEDMKKVEWIRPTKMVSDPQLVVDGESRFDFAQGDVGNCWFLAAIGAITFEKEIMDQIIPAGQSFRREYAGIFHFRFWRFGKWIDVVIDDKLPTIDGQLIFIHCKTRNEFWPALLEKAYAKVCGSYADMSGGFVSEGLADFTGGVHMTLFPGKEEILELWRLMYGAMQYRSIMGCGTPQGATSANTVLSNGIVEGHAYTVTRVTKVKSKGQGVRLVRVLNPWGRGEWVGDWSDNSPLWKTVSSEDRAKLLESKNDGEFWMSLEDFCSSFMNVDICCLTPAFLDGSAPESWTTKQYVGCWDEKTAGGSMEHKQSFWMNPQYQVMVPVLGEKWAELPGWNLLVSLMQKPDKRNRRLVQHLHIGFSVFSIPPEIKDQKVFPASFFSSNAPVTQSRPSSDTREVMQSFRMKPGRYLIIPYTCKPNDTTSFLLTVHSKTDPN